jgi:hypothetical protein
VNFTTDNTFQINLVQCRPLQTKGEGKRVAIPKHIPKDHTLFQTKGNFMGSNIMQPIKRIIFVDPEAYSTLSLSERYDIARLIGKLNRQINNREEHPTLLVGPGRWGTTTPSLGIPVRFSEINNIAVIVELAHMTGSLMPELSFGTHFFQDLVETDIFYVALFPDKEQALFNRKLIEKGRNMLSSILPGSGRYEHAVIVRDVEKERFFLRADVVSQMLVCYSSLKTDQ